MKAAIGISMFDEHELVLNTIQTIIESDAIEPYFVVAHSDDESSTSALEAIKELAHKYILLSDVSKEKPTNYYQSHCVSRNYSNIFRSFYEADEIDSISYFVALTGDTLVTDPSNFNRLYDYMIDNNKVACVSQAIGQRFHAATDDLHEFVGSRYQHDKITDFMPQLFLLEGKFAKNTKCFFDIEVTNELTSEQCLGDELSSHLEKEFHTQVHRLNSMVPTYAYAYSDGIVYHARNGKPGR